MTVSRKVDIAAAQALLRKSPRAARVVSGLIEREAGYVNHPNDPGGATNYGVTERVARLNGYTGDMRDMPRDFAEAVYVYRYIQGPRFDDVMALSAPIADELIDTGVNCGLSLPGRSLQRGLNAFNKQATVYRDIATDGVIGDNTMAMLAAYLEYRRHDDGERVMVKLLDSVQGAYYLGLSEDDDKYESFVYGWFAHRIGNVQFGGA